MPAIEEQTWMKVSDNGFLRIRQADGIQLSIPLLRDTTPIEAITEYENEIEAERELKYALINLETSELTTFRLLRSSEARERNAWWSDNRQPWRWVIVDPSEEPD